MSDSEIDTIKGRLLEGFDLLAQELRDYDAKTEGGYLLLWSDDFNQAACGALKPDQRLDILKTSLSVHHLLKSLGAEVWCEWFRRERHGSPQEQFNQALVHARESLDRNFEDVPAGGLEGRFFDKALVQIDDLANGNPRLSPKI